MSLIATIDDQITNRRIYARLAASIVPGATPEGCAGSAQDCEPRDNGHMPVRG